MPCLPCKAVLSASSVFVHLRLIYPAFCSDICWGCVWKRHTFTQSVTRCTLLRSASTSSDEHHFLIILSTMLPRARADAGDKVSKPHCPEFYLGEKVAPKHMYEGQRKALRGLLYPSALTWDPGIKLGPSGLVRKHLHQVSYLPGPSHIFLLDL